MALALLLLTWPLACDWELPSLAWLSSSPTSTPPYLSPSPSRTVPRPSFPSPCTAPPGRGSVMKPGILSLRTARNSSSTPSTRVHEASKSTGISSLGRRWAIVSATRLATPRGKVSREGKQECLKR